jgi:DNA-binding LacI/PurR family transcriptional regulator
LASDDEFFHFFGDSTEETGHCGTMQLWSRLDRPTAIISLSNVMTTGSLLALRQHGARIPEDVSVIGFDDLPYFELLDPPLTAIAQPTYEVGQCAGELLLAGIESGGDLSSEPQQVRLPTQLIVRASCRCLAAEPRRSAACH